MLAPALTLWHGAAAALGARQRRQAEAHARRTLEAAVAEVASSKPRMSMLDTPFQLPVAFSKLRRERARTRGSQGGGWLERHGEPMGGSVAIRETAVNALSGRSTHPKPAALEAPSETSHAK